MSDPSSADHSAMYEGLSALADGRATPQQTDHTLAAWNADADLRLQWRAYHSLADLMRSPAADASRPGAASDDAFLERLREQMAVEPTVFAPSALSTSPHHRNAQAARQRWWGPVGVAASLLLITSSLMTLLQHGVDQQADARKTTLATLPANVTMESLVAPGAAAALAADSALLPVLGQGLQPLSESMVTVPSRPAVGHGVYALTLRQDQMDALWPGWRNQAGEGGRSALPGNTVPNMVVPVFVFAPGTP